MPFKDETGKKYGKWTVLAKAASKDRAAYWTCRCECGAEKDVAGHNLRRGQSRACLKCANKDARPLAERFADYCSPTPDENGCINWTGGTHAQGGYACFHDCDADKIKSAHVVAWELVNGPVPTEPPPDGSFRWEIHHRCHNVICVNEQHLQLVTNKEHARLEIESAPKVGGKVDVAASLYKQFPGFMWHRIERAHVAWAWSCEL